MTVIDRTENTVKPDHQALFKLTYGMHILCARQDGKDNGCIVNTAVQVTDTPHRLSVTVNKKSLTRSMILETGRFTVSNLSERATFDVFERFGFRSGRDEDKFADFSGWERDKEGLPYLTEGANAFFSCEVERTVDLDTHTLFIAKITDMAILDEAASMTYSFYQEHLRPKGHQPSHGEKTVWRCVVCGWEYIGDELPEDIVCPLCKHGASDFIRVDD